MRGEPASARDAGPCARRAVEDGGAGAGQATFAMSLPAGTHQVMSDEETGGARRGVSPRRAGSGAGLDVDVV